MKLDLITGFLGSGKTTFIVRYATYLKSIGKKVLIIENDFGPINVDTLFFENLKELNIDIFMITSSKDIETYKRRLKTKLIEALMLKYDHVIMEPSGIYNIDTFFDVLYDISSIKLNSVISIMDLKMLKNNLIIDDIFILEMIKSAKIFVRNYDNNYKFIDILNKMAKNIKSDRVFNTTDFINLDNFNDFSIIDNLYYKDYLGSISKKLNYDNLFLINLKDNKEDISIKIDKLFKDESYGKILRVKGFIKDEFWYKINKTINDFEFLKVEDGQNVIIIIGQDLNKDNIYKLFNYEGVIWNI
jgi:G3E family GTPase